VFALTGLDWALVLASALFVGLAKTAFNGVGLLTVIMMATVFPAKESTGIVLPVLVFGDLFAVLFYRRHGSPKTLLRLFPFAVAGVVAGFLFMDRIDNLQLRRIIGWLVLLMVAGSLFLKLRREGLNAQGVHFAAPTGIFAGFTTMIANAGGPVMTVYFEAMGVKKEEFVGNMAWFFAGINLIKVPFSVRLGLVTTVSQKTFDISVQALAAASAIHLIAV